MLKGKNVRIIRQDGLRCSPVFAGQDFPRLFDQMNGELSGDYSRIFSSRFPELDAMIDVTGATHWADTKRVPSGAHIISSSITNDACF